MNTIEKSKTKNSTRVCEDCGKSVSRKIKKEVVVCHDCSRKRYNRKRRKKRRDVNKIIYDTEGVNELIKNDRTVDFVPTVYEKIGTVTEDDLKVIIVNGKPRIKGLLKLRNQL